MSLESRPESSLVSQFIILRQFWIIYIRTLGDQPKQLHWEVQNDLNCLWMTTHKEFGYTQHHKHKVLDAFFNWKKMIDTQTDRKIKQLSLYNNGKYKSDPFMKLCQNEDIT